DEGAGRNPPADAGAALLARRVALPVVDGGPSGDAAHGGFDDGACDGTGAPFPLTDGAAREGKHDCHGPCHDLELAHRFPPGSVKTDWLRVTESCKLVNGTGAAAATGRQPPRHQPATTSARRFFARPCRDLRHRHANLPSRV